MITQNIFKDPIEARKYVLSFGDKFFGKKIKYIETNKRKINIYDMSDNDAICVANMLKAQIELGGMKRK